MNSKEIERKIEYLQKRDDTIAGWINEMYHDLEWNANAQGRKITALEKEISVLKYVTRAQMDVIRELQTEDDNLPIPESTSGQFYVSWQVRMSKIVHATSEVKAQNIIARMDQPVGSSYVPNSMKCERVD